jgi:hypothetical protein
MLEESQRMNDAKSGDPSVGLDAVPRWRIYLYLAVYATCLGGIFIWHQYEHPEFSIWKTMLGFAVAYSIPPVFFIWVNRFTNRDYALKHGPVVFKAWLVVMGIQILWFVAKLLTDK